MRSLHIIMPMGGLGIRFKNKGFDCPKPLINVDNNPMFMKAINSLSPINCEKEYTFIVRFDHNKEYDIANRIKKVIPTANFVILAENTRGAAETCSMALNFIKDDQSIIVLDCDLEFRSDEYVKDIEEDINKNIDDCEIAGRLVSFPSVNPRYSYAKIDENRFVIETAEKKVISNHAITGSYYFSSKKIFSNAIERLLFDFDNSLINTNEVYLSLLYNYIIKDNKKVKLYDLNKYNSFGTPEELEEYLKKTKTKILGHSGCKVEIAKENEQLVVKKFTYDKSYFKRLKNQMNKQIDFHSKDSYNNIKTPNILNIVEDEDSCCATMDYIDGISFIDYFEKNDKKKIEDFSNSMIKYIDDEINSSKTINISNEIFLTKFNDVEKKILANKSINSDEEITGKIIDKYRKIFEKNTYYEMPVGVCHGDLTLSNVMFGNDDNIYLIDFLDSFIETPYMDIVKLRQDTKYNWSYLLIENKKDIFDDSKYALAKIDKIIYDHYKCDSKFKASYDVLQCMNFLRILQYAHNDIIIEYLKNILINYKF